MATAQKGGAFLMLEFTLQLAKSLLKSVLAHYVIKGIDNLFKRKQKSE